MLLALLAAMSPAPGTPGETYTCHFGQYGMVVINTRYPGATMTVGGRTILVYGGSDFFQARDGDEFILFGPNMRFWIYHDIRDNHCVRRPNRRR